MKTACWTMAFVFCVSAALAAQTQQQPDPLAQCIEDFGRNAALGAPLTMREGTSAELEELTNLAESGLKLARQAVARNPDSAQAHYWLGSWLLYGYGVVEVEQISFDPEGGARTETISQAVQGMTDDPDEGLAELQRSVELAPDEEKGDYVLDYATALLDYERIFDAMGLLKAAWAGDPPLTQEQKMLAGLLLSDASAAEGNLDGARGWIYTALSLDPVGALAVERLRQIDAAQVAEMLAAAAKAAERPAAPEAEIETGTWPEYPPEEWPELEAQEWPEMPGEEWEWEETEEGVGGEEEYYPEENQ